MWCGKGRHGKDLKEGQGSEGKELKEGGEGKKGEIDWSTQLREDFVPARDTPEIHN